MPELSLAESFEVAFDEQARRWLDEHPSQDALVIAYEHSRCCGGGHLRDLRLRRGRDKDERSKRLLNIGEIAGRPLLLDRRIMPRLPRVIPITVGGLGLFRGLHLDFSGEEWARLLYDQKPA